MSKYGVYGRFLMVTLKSSHELIIQFKDKINWSEQCIPSLLVHLRISLFR
jgi:hypothetical protein